MYLPPGYREDLRETHVCILQKSLYGFKQGSINWYLHLQEGLRKRCFRQSELNPGIYFSPTLVLITYADDLIVIARDHGTINKLLVDFEIPFVPKNKIRFQIILDFKSTINLFIVP